MNVDIGYEFLVKIIAIKKVTANSKYIQSLITLKRNFRRVAQINSSLPQEGAIVAEQLNPTLLSAAQSAFKQ